MDRPVPPASARRTEARRSGTPAARRAIKVTAAATGVGLLTGFFGVGGGFVIVPALVLALGFDMPAAVGTSLLVISVNSAAALGARLGEGVHLDWRLTGVFTLAALAGTLAGNRVASRVSASRLTAAFTVLLIAVAAYTLSRTNLHTGGNEQASAREAVLHAAIAQDITERNRASEAGALKEYRDISKEILVDSVPSDFQPRLRRAGQNDVRGG